MLGLFEEKTYIWREREVAGSLGGKRKKKCPPRAVVNHERGEKEMITEVEKNEE